MKTDSKPDDKTTKAAATDGKTDGKTIECRVTAPTYGRTNPKFKGEIVKVPEREYHRLREEIVEDGRLSGEFRYPVLISLEEEERRRKEQVQPEQDTRRNEVARKKQEALAGQEAERERLMKEHRRGKAREALEANGE